MKRRIIILFFMLFALFPLPSLAATDIEQAQSELCNLDFSLGGKAGSASNDCLSTEDGIWKAMDNIVDRLPYYLTGLAFFAFLYSGAMYIFAFGDSARQESAKKNMVWTATGMIILASIGLIIRFTRDIATRATNGTTGQTLYTNPDEIEGINK